MSKPNKGAAVAPAAPTQVKHPGRALVRTLIQVVIPAIITLGLIVPLIVDIILEEATLPDGMVSVLVSTAGVITALSLILTRIMAIPQVEAFLERVKGLSWMAASPKGGDVVATSGADVWTTSADPAERGTGGVIHDPEAEPGRHKWE